MSSGKIHQANEGCSCAMGTVMTQFIQNLRLTEDQFALMDMEAGVEHFIYNKVYAEHIHDQLSRVRNSLHR